jgi:hypothetical protein
MPRGHPSLPGPRGHRSLLGLQQPRPHDLRRPNSSPTAAKPQGLRRQQPKRPATQEACGASNPKARTQRAAKPSAPDPSSAHGGLALHGSFMPRPPSRPVAAHFVPGNITLYRAVRRLRKAPGYAVFMIMGRWCRISTRLTHDHGTNTPVRVSRNELFISLFHLKSVGCYGSDRALGENDP